MNFQIPHVPMPATKFLGYIHIYRRIMISFLFVSILMFLLIPFYLLTGVKEIIGYAGILWFILFVVMVVLNIGLWISVSSHCNKIYHYLEVSGKELKTKILASQRLISFGRFSSPCAMGLEVELTPGRKVYFLDYFPLFIHTWSSCRYFPKQGEIATILYDPKNIEFMMLKRPHESYPLDKPVARWKLVFLMFFVIVLTAALLIGLSLYYRH